MIKNPEDANQDVDVQGYSSTLLSPKYNEFIKNKVSVKNGIFEMYYNKNRAVESDVFSLRFLYNIVKGIGSYNIFYLKIEEALNTLIVRITNNNWFINRFWILINANNIKDLIMVDNVADNSEFTDEIDKYLNITNNVIDTMYLYNTILTDVRVKMHNNTITTLVITNNKIDHIDCVNNNILSYYIKNNKREVDGKVVGDSTIDSNCLQGIKLKEIPAIPADIKNPKKPVKPEAEPEFTPRIIFFLVSSIVAIILAITILVFEFCRCDSKLTRLYAKITKREFVSKSDFLLSNEEL